MLRSFWNSLKNAYGQKSVPLPGSYSRGLFSCCHTIRYNGETGRFYPSIKTGEVLGVGQHTTSGFGRYRLITA
ncbi:MAG TPA: CRISPR system precrRNA processing endoribonuclease RAMP protein Cas6 [Euryarchaeota archaeon]|nr:CRISPR system precrRNA processing endoribonuclease RAMP protein Cas6 [Euryarchaeota archaeon]